MRLKDVNIYPLLIALFLSLSFEAIGRETAPKPFVETRIEREKAVEGERLIYEVVLKTPVSSIAGVELALAPGFGELPFKQSAPDSSFEKEEIDGTTYYVTVIDRYFVGFNHNGKFKLRGGVYRLGINHPVQINDPFWGPSIGNRVEVAELKAPDLMVKVSSLPEKGKTEKFSGAIGDFEVAAMLPEGEIRAGEDAYLVITVSGPGDLGNAALPDIRKAFPAGLQFKSLTENRTYYVKDGSLCSEIEIECIFSPKEKGHYVLKGIDFEFYNSKTGRYETATSSKLEIEVGDGSLDSDRPPVVIDI